MERLCVRCNLQKPINRFRQDQGPQKNRPRAYCKDCQNLLTQDSAYKKYNNQLKHYYGIDLEDWARMYNAQEGRCASNPEHKLSFGRDSHVDHDHKTGKIRGILCPGCNRALGGVLDDVKTLELLIAYLKHHTEAPATRGVSHKNSENAENVS